MMRLLFFLLVVTAAFAQTPTPAPTPVPASKPIWRCNLPGGTYEVGVGSIISVSSHEYIVDAAAKVSEVNVDTGGALTVRFYVIEPVTNGAPGGLGGATLAKVQSVVTEAAERSGTDAWKKVVKSYPVTTHARTVEYRLANRDALNKLFHSASRAFRSGKGEDHNVSE